jgi:hypothetical protein
MRRVALLATLLLATPGVAGCAGADGQRLGDTRVVLYISERSHLPLHTLVDMTIEAGGQSADMHLDFTITGVNEPVKIPQPRA